MKKEDILKKAREEGFDEMEKFVQNRSMWWGALIMCILLIVFSIIRRENGQCTFDLTATICAGVAVENFFQYAKLRSKQNLALGIIISVCAVLSAFWFFTKL